MKIFVWRIGILAVLIMCPLAGQTAAESSTPKNGSSMAQKIRDFFSDHELGGVYYYDTLGSNANIVREQIAGEKFINAAYSKFSSRKIRQALQKVGTKAQVSTRTKDTDDIKKFVDKYAIDMTDYTYEKPADFEDFNDFFYRTLKPEVRKIDARDFVVTSPADCKLRVIAPITPTSKFFIKQDFFSLRDFLADDLLAQEYQDGTLLVFRLAPTDYHRFHFPFACTPLQPFLIMGEYETVNPIAFRAAGLWPISINKRARLSLHSPVFGKVIMMVVGASMVASLNFTYQPMVEVAKGDEAGYFAFGGSTICLLFKKGAIEVPAELVKRSTNIRVAAKPGLKKPSKEDATYEKEAPFETAVLMGQGVAMKKGSKHLNGLINPAYIDFLSKKNRALLLKQDGVDIPFMWNKGIAPAAAEINL